MTPSLNILVGTTDLLHEGVELLLLLAEGGFSIEDARLTLALILLLLVGGLLVSSVVVVSWRCFYKAGPLWCLVSVRGSLARDTAVTPQILDLNFFFSSLAEFRRYPFLFPFLLAKP
jgi:hypothetical protein